MSPRYAIEIQGQGENHNDGYDYSAGLLSIYQSLGNRLHGVLNGLDYEVWDPSTDKALGSFRYDAHTAVSMKPQIKEALQREMGLPVDPNIPLVGVVGRLDRVQKGLDLVADIIPRFAGRLQFAILGSGDTALQNLLAELKQKYPQTLGLIIGFDEQLGRRIYAASDLFPVPSRYEPCGLTQMIAMRYGAIPIVRRTGGLADTVVDALLGGTGFVFANYHTIAFEEALDRALTFFHNRPADWSSLLRRAMEARFRWEDAVQKYIALYQ